jgi:hypothetical protein
MWRFWWCEVLPRKRRIEYPGALYHVQSQVEWRDDIFLDDVDRLRFHQDAGCRCRPASTAPPASASPSSKMLSGSTVLSVTGQKILNAKTQRVLSLCSLCSLWLRFRVLDVMFCAPGHFAAKNAENAEQSRKDFENIAAAF